MTLQYDDSAMTATERKSDFKITTYTPYLTLTGKVWGIYCENFDENCPRYNDTALYTCLLDIRAL